MAEERQPFQNTMVDGKPQPSEKITTHNKKAQAVAIGLVVLLISGLALQSFFQMRSRNQQVAQKKEEPAPPARSNKADFRQKTAEAEQAILLKARQADVAADQVAAQADARKLAANSITGPDGAKNYAAQERASDTAASTAINTPEQVEERWLLEERKRALDSQRAGIGRVQVRGAIAPSVKPSASSTGARTSPEVATQLSKIQETQARLAQIRDQLGASIGGQSGGIAAQNIQPTSGGQVQGQQVPRPSSMRDDVVGEPGINRATRTPSNPGPASDERVLSVGSVMSATLDMDLISDYEGNWRAVIARDVYDPTNEYILVPQGSRAVGRVVRVSKVNEVIQNRMGLIPKWIVRPDGKRIDFTKSAGIDSAGVGAIPGDANYHIGVQLGGLVAYGILGLVPSFTTESGDPQSSQDTALKDVTGGFRARGREFANKYLNVVPTITVPAGTPMKIFIEDDIYVRPWARVDDTIYPTARARY